MLADGEELILSKPDAAEVDRLMAFAREHFTKEACLLYTSDAADERSSVDLGGRRIIKKKNTAHIDARRSCQL